MMKIEMTNGNLYVALIFLPGNTMNISMAHLRLTQSSSRYINQDAHQG